MLGVRVSVVGAVAPLRLAESHPPVWPDPYTMVPAARPLSVPVPPFETLTDCADGLAAPAVAENVAAAEERMIAGADAPGCVPPVDVVLLSLPPPPHASTPAPTRTTKSRRMHPRTR